MLDNSLALYEDGDVRKDVLGIEASTGKLRNLVKYPDPNGVDDILLVRFEEIVLNYAEALFENGNTSEALTQINLLTQARGASLITSLTKEVFLNERRKELMFEGYRFDDLMRSKSNIDKIDPKQGFAATIPYGDYRLAFPLPDDELNANSQIKQNKGY